MDVDSASAGPTFKHGGMLAVQTSILKRMAVGFPDEVIAVRFGPSVRTCRGHIATIFEVLGAESRFQAGAITAARFAEVANPSPADGAPGDLEKQRETYWIITSEAAAEDGSGSKAAVAAATAFLADSGWTQVYDTPLDPGGIAGAEFTKAEQSIGIEAIQNGDSFRIEVMVQTSCFKHSNDHHMTRTPTDPDFGKSSSYYLDE